MGTDFFTTGLQKKMEKIGEDFLRLSISKHSDFYGAVWITQNAPVGERMVTLSVTASTFVALFMAGCISIIARILSQASEVDSENRTFI